MPPLAFWFNGLVFKRFDVASSVGVSVRLSFLEPSDGLGPIGLTDGSQTFPPSGR